MFALGPPTSKGHLLAAFFVRTGTAEQSLGKSLSMPVVTVVILLLMPLYQRENRPEEKRLARERLTLSKMAGIYCSAHHDNTADILCASCQEFLDYADVRLEKCPYGADKPTCANCPIHCYKPAQKAQARTIMRYAGPRMLLRHPLLAIAHQLDGLRKARHPRELTREQRAHAQKTVR